MIMVLTKPDSQPAWWNAFGIARMPVPNDPFSKWTRVSELLCGKYLKRFRTGQCANIMNVSLQITWSDAAHYDANADRSPLFPDAVGPRCHYNFCQGCEFVRIIVDFRYIRMAKNTHFKAMSSFFAEDILSFQLKLVSNLESVVSDLQKKKRKFE